MENLFLKEINKNLKSNSVVFYDIDFYCGASLLLVLTIKNKKTSLTKIQEIRISTKEFREIESLNRFYFCNTINHGKVIDFLELEKKELDVVITKEKDITAFKIESKRNWAIIPEVVIRRRYEFLKKECPNILLKFELAGI